MNVVLFHRGQNLSYFEICIEQIRRFNLNCDIHFIGTENQYLPTFIHFHHISELNSEYVQKFFNNDFLINNSNPLFRTAIERFFYIECLGLNNVVHFDNDVMVYGNFNIFRQANCKGVWITPSNEFNLVCGMMYWDNNHSFQILIKKLMDFIEIGEKNLLSRYVSRQIVYKNECLDEFHINEMTLLKLVQEQTNIVSMLPIMPDSVGYDTFGYCFDPSSWGQYLGGTHQGHPSGFYDLNHYIGRELQKKKYTVLFECHRPIIQFNEMKFPLFNLHIHSKQLNLFV